MPLKTVAQPGDVIVWNHPKFQFSLKGTVIKGYVNSVVVEIHDYDKVHFEIFPTDRTVVNHKRYKTIPKENVVN